jgi:propanol-preferring alcohol dehydrogenase
VAVPEPGHGEVLVKIGGAGACHSDLHIMHEWDPESFPPVASWPLPFTLGHENAGWIEGGDIPSGMEAGQPVVVSPTWSCGVCKACREGATNYCQAGDLLAGGLGLDGGFAEYMVAPAACLVSLDTLEPWQAAPLTDAGLTSYHAVKRCLPLLSPDTTAVVIGVGGLGHLGVEFLRLLSGARIIAVDTDAGALEIARQRGADICLQSGPDTAREILALTGDQGAAAVLDFVGAEATMATSAQVVGKRGQVVMVGMGGGVLPLYTSAIHFGASVTFTLGGSTPELAEIVALAEAGRLQPELSRYSLAEVDEVYRKLHANEISGRAVIVP